VKALLKVIFAFLNSIMGKKEENGVIPLIPVMDKKIAWKKSPNYTRKGNARSITAIILHHTGSFNASGELKWMCDVESEVSAHYLIDLSGNITQMVNDKDVAWHAGRSKLDGKKYVNNFSLGIELTGDTAKKPLTKDQYKSLLWLVRKLMDKYSISAHRVVDHRKVAIGRKVDLDPKNFNWNDFYNEIG